MRRLRSWLRFLKGLIAVAVGLYGFILLSVTVKVISSLLVVRLPLSIPARIATVNAISPFLAVLLPLPIPVMIARDRRRGCAWNLDEANNQIIAAVLMISLSLLLVAYMSAALSREPGSPIAIGLALLLWYGVYRLARAIYRKRDLRGGGSSIDVTDTEEKSAPVAPKP